MSGRVYSFRPWKPELSEEWDSFVLEKSGNGTLFHTRRFLSYHPEGRFEDRSVLVDADGELVCVVAAAVWNGGVFSHPGTSCGGPVVRRDWWKSSRLFPLLDAVAEHFGPRFGMRVPEPCFSSVDASALLWRFSRNAELRPELGVVSELRSGFCSYENSSRAKNVETLARDRGWKFGFAESEADFRAFHGILSENLRKFGTAPVHSADELVRLAGILGEDQKLALLRSAEGEILCGTWLVRATPAVWHSQYVARAAEEPHPAEDNPRRGDCDFLFVESMRFARGTGAEFFSRGIATEERGLRLNEGLYAFKERQGGGPQLRWIVLPRETEEKPR